MASGKTPSECGTCAYLKDCQEVTEPHILNRERCSLWKAADEAELAARQSIEQDFGIWALRYAVPRLVRATHTTRRKRSHG